jgi:hypothetical protein
MKKVILFLVCIIGSCIIPSMHAQVERLSIARNEVLGGPIVQPGLVMLIEDWTPAKVGNDLEHWTILYFKDDEAVEMFQYRQEEHCAVVTVIIRDDYKEEIELSAMVRDFYWYLNYLAKGIYGGKVSIAGISEDL